MRHLLLTFLTLVCLPEATVRCFAVDGGVPGPRPWIGITSTLEDGKVVCQTTYVEAIRRAGAIPLVVPVMDDDRSQADYLDRLDGLVLIGGWDIPPGAYGEKPHPTTEVMPPARWDWESRLVRMWLDSDKPLLGICLGAQMTNVVTGGSLIQDIPSEIGAAVVHRDRDRVEHPVTVARESLLHGILQTERLAVQSSHHQAAKRLGRGLVAVARSDDGVVEAMEMPERRGWLLLLQWHPERMAESHQRKIFGAFVENCRVPADAIPSQPGSH